MPNELLAAFGVLLIAFLVWFCLHEHGKDRDAAAKAGKIPSGQSDYEPHEDDGK